MTALHGSTDAWNDLLAAQVPVILELVLTTWARLPRPASDEWEDSITGRLCAALQRSPDRERYPFHIRSQVVLLDPASGCESGRTDILFMPWVPSDEVYFCLECKRLNPGHAGETRPYHAEYVSRGMQRFVDGQYAGEVEHGGMLGYVLDGSLDAAISGVERNIARLRERLGMSGPPDFRSSAHRPDDRRVRETHHRRQPPAGRLVLHHMFVAPDPAAPATPPAPPPPSAPAKPARAAPRSPARRARR